MAKVERASPMNNSSLESVISSPNFLNTSDSFKFLTPGVANFRRSCSPLNLNISNSPNISPIKSKTPRSPFAIKKRDITNRREKILKKQKHGLINKVQNINEATLSVKVILEELNLTEYLNLFEDEEIYLDVFFTICDDDLKAIGIDSKEHRQKILDFISNFSTPKKSVIKNVNYRN